MKILTIKQIDNDDQWSMMIMANKKKVMDRSGVIKQKKVSKRKKIESVNDSFVFFFILSFFSKMKLSKWKLLTIRCCFHLQIALR